MRIIQNNALLDKLTSCIGQNQNFKESLKILKPKDSVGSLSMYDEYSDEEYRTFRLLSTKIEEGAAYGSETFPGFFLGPFKKNVILQQEFQQLLAEFYCNTYNKDFVTLLHIHKASESSIPVDPNVDQYSRLRIGTEVFGSKLSSRHVKSAKILARFFTDDDNSDIYPGQVQFFFEHTVRLPEVKTHYLAFVRWYKAAENHKTRFHCRIDNNDDRTCNIELWKPEFYEVGRDCIIPIHNILCRFVSGSFEVGKRKPKKYMSIIPINRKFHI